MYGVIGMCVLVKNGEKSLFFLPKTKIDLDGSKMDQNDPNKSSVTHF